jgi:hypothetical protein
MAKRLPEFDSQSMPGGSVAAAKLIHERCVCEHGMERQFQVRVRGSF